MGRSDGGQVSELIDGLFNIVQTNRLCPICHTDIEDEFHFILNCPMYNDLRKLYIKPF